MARSDHGTKRRSGPSRGPSSAEFGSGNGRDERSLVAGSSNVAFARPRSRAQRSIQYCCRHWAWATMHCRTRPVPRVVDAPAVIVILYSTSAILPHLEAIWHDVFTRHRDGCSEPSSRKHVAGRHRYSLLEPYTSPAEKQRRACHGATPCYGAVALGTGKVRAMQHENRRSVVQRACLCDYLNGRVVLTDFLKILAGCSVAGRS